MRSGNYILWLPSWYPNEREPFNGDFIQRHAKAASLNDKIIVIFFTEFGETVRQQAKVVNAINGNLEEITVYIPFKPFGIRFIDRIRYNFQFYRLSAIFLQTFFREHGLPLLVHVHVPVKAGNLALWIKKKFSVPYIVSEQSSTYLEQAGKDYFKRRHWVYRQSVKRIFSGALLVTNVSRAVGEILQELFTIKQMSVIYNVVDTEMFRPALPDQSCFTYIHVSSLTEQKNIFGILGVFKRLASIRTDWKFLVVGPYTSEIQSFIIKEKLDDLISLRGEVSHEIVANLMSQANALVLFSRHENFPCVVVESLCCGIPVIASDVAGINECVDKSNGMLVQSEDEDSLLRALLEIREVYHTYDHLSIAKEAAGRFSYPVIGENFKKLYEHAVQRSHSSKYEKG